MVVIQGHHKPHQKAHPNKLEVQAKEAMTSRGCNYVTGGTGERATMDANRLAFRQWKAMKFSCVLDMLPWQDMAQHLPLQVYCVGQ